MKPDVLPTTDVKALIARGDVAVLLDIDFKLIEPGPAGCDLRTIDCPGGGAILLVKRAFGPLLPGKFLRFRSLTGDTNWSDIADYCSIFDCARMLTEYATRKAAGTRTYEHG